MRAVALAPVTMATGSTLQHGIIDKFNAALLLPYPKKQVSPSLCMFSCLQRPF